MNKKLINHIQFLRAFAVLLVFFYHIKLNYFEYGYIGVDIFFVISGYVITSRIYFEYIEFKNFNFLNFYKKRIKRIYPALLFIFSISLIFIVFFQPLDLFVNNFKVYVFTLFGTSNLYYLFSNKDYFDNVFSDPFGHSWSLGIEEQFYLFFPILFIIILKYIKNINLNIIFISGIIVVGIILTYTFSNNKELIFYSPFFRFWQLLLGSLAFLISTKIDTKNPFISILIFLSLIFLILENNFLNEVNFILVSSILSCFFLIIYKKEKYAQILFENKYLIFVGNLSYSFYLWHLPIIYFYDLYFVGNYLRIPLIFLITLTLSYLTFKYIEENFRNKKYNLHLYKKRLIFILFLCLSAILISNYIIVQKSYNNLVKQKIKNYIYKLNYLENTKNYYERTVFYNIKINGNRIYRFCTESSKEYKLSPENLRAECLKNKKSKKLLFIEGDSHTAQFIPMVDSIKSDHAFYYKHNSNHLININHEEINLLTKFYNEIIYSTHISNKEDLRNLITNSKNFNDKVKILIYGPVPNVDKKIRPLECFIKSINCEFETEIDIKDRNLNEYYKIVNKILKEKKNFYFYDPYKIICPQKRCYIYNLENDLLTHRDSTHLTIEGSLMLKKNFKNFFNIKFN